MEPENFSLIGWGAIAVGAVCTAIGLLFYGRVLDCLTTPTICSQSPSTSVANLEIGLAFLVVGGPAFFAGTIFAAAGHLTEHLRPLSKEEESLEDTPRRRLCMKCGHEITASARFCEYCGNRLSESQAGQP